MNAYVHGERQQAKVNREHFIMYHWLFFRECRSWTPDDWFDRLKSEGLIARSTYRLDFADVTKFIIGLKQELF